jgi:hypothetical protein
MSLDTVYHIARIQCEGIAAQRLLTPLRERSVPAIEAAGGGAWGIFTGLLGLDTRELYLVTSWAPGTSPSAAVTSAMPVEARIVQERTMVPTVRPLTPAPMTRAGVYVFRWFEVNNRDIREIAALSREAWETFENTTAYEAEPQALLRDADASADRGTMLLVTWYEGLRSWELSRTPAPEARANFVKRAQLTLSALPIATRLAVD